MVINVTEFSDWYTPRINPFRFNRVCSVQYRSHRVNEILVSKLKLRFQSRDYRINLDIDYSLLTNIQPEIINTGFNIELR